MGNETKDRQTDQSVGLRRRRRKNDSMPGEESKKKEDLLPDTSLERKSWNQVIHQQGEGERKKHPNTRGARNRHLNGPTSAKDIRLVGHRSSHAGKEKQSATARRQREKQGAFEMQREKGQSTVGAGNHQRIET